MSVNKSAVGVFEEFAEEYLNFEKTPKKNIFWLDTMEFLCRRFRNPELFCPSIHIAGSKGKGSVSMMISSILREQGITTGLYSSPHILNFIERITDAGTPFSEEVYEKSVRELIELINSIPLNELPGERPITWFELVTLLAMISFKNAGCGFSVYEVGLGGRLDATNVIKPACCCINQIELEHTEFLGNTIEKIAAEKGGIIKEGIPVIVSEQTETVSAVFKNIAREKNAPIYFVNELSKISEPVYKNRQLTFVLTSSLFKRPLNICLKMLGDFQAKNAAMAAIAVKMCCPEISEETIETGLSKACLPGRFEISDGIVYDGAHTVNSIRFTMETFKKLFPGNVHLLFGCAADKDVDGIARLFKDSFSKVTLTKPGCVKESDIEKMKTAFDSCKIQYTSCSDYLKAIPMAIEKAKEEKCTLLVTGSFYLVSEVKKYLISKKCTQ